MEAMAIYIPGLGEWIRNEPPVDLSWQRLSLDICIFETLLNEVNCFLDILNYPDVWVDLKEETHIAVIEGFKCPCS